MDLALNKLQRLICHKTQHTKPTSCAWIRDHSESFKPNFILSDSTTRSLIIICERDNQED